MFNLGGWVNCGIICYAGGKGNITEAACVSVCVLIWALQVEQSANIKAPPAEGEEEEEEEKGGS